MASNIKQAVEKEVTCPLCLDLYKEPKKLPCDHVYCKNCLKGVALRSLDQSISCPECRNVTDVPNDDVNNFPTAFRMNRLIEAFQNEIEETDYHSDMQDTTYIPKGSNCCTVHQDQTLALYCETCKRMMCRDCVIMTEEHAQHKYDYIEKVAKKYREKQEKRLLMTNKQRELLSQLHSRISEVECAIVSKEKANLEEIDHSFEELFRTLQKNRCAMKKQLSQEYQSALNVLLRQKQQIESVQEEEARVTALVERSLQCKDEELLAQEKLIENNVEKLQKQTEQLPVTVNEPSLPVAQIMKYHSLEKQLDTWNFLYTPPDPKKCEIGGDLEQAETNKPYVIMMNLVDSKGKKCVRGSHDIKAELCVARDHTTMTGSIKQPSPECIIISFDSLKRGRHELNVTMKGAHVMNSPHSLFVHIPPPQLQQPVAQITNLKRPTGLTCCGNSILAVEFDNDRILKFNTDHEVVDVYGEDKLKHPAEVTTDQQMNIYVSTWKDHKVHKLANNGIHLRSTGTQGTKPGQFDCPCGLRVSSWEELYICDRENNRIQVFDLQLNYKRVFGGPGTKKGQFRLPSDLDFDNSDNIYISDYENHRIQVFTPQEQFIRFIGYKRVRPKELENPLALRIFNKSLFVAHKRHIAVYKLSGELVIAVEGVLQQPEGLEVDKDGYVYVSSHYSKIVVF